jgi:putative spermidine/putrescine transport system permease protein
MAPSAATIPWVLLPRLPLLAVFCLPVVQLLMLSGSMRMRPTSPITSDCSPLQVLAITFKIAAWTTAITLLGGYPIAYFLATATNKPADWYIGGVCCSDQLLVRTLA